MKYRLMSLMRERPLRSAGEAEAAVIADVVGLVVWVKVVYVVW